MVEGEKAPIDVDQIMAQLREKVRRSQEVAPRHPLFASIRGLVRRIAMLISRRED
jgi:hypothetical protein